VENVQRAELSPLEEATAYRRLMDEFSFTQAEVAETVGRERSTVANLLRLLALPASVQRMVNEGALTMGHARALLGLEDERAMADLAREAATAGLTVRAVEERVRNRRSDAERGARRPRPAAPDAHLRTLEQELQRAFGTRVRIRVTGSDAGRIEIPFLSADDFQAVVDRLLPVNG
jgi:ParB family transcriptional regulator, chromosome partitioning protein